MGALDKLKKSGIKVGVPKRKSPVWRGPERDGITFSLLSRFLTCRERFRLLVVEGLRTAKEFSPRMEFGNMWHVCEERLAGAVKGRDYRRDGEELGHVFEGLKAYCQDLCKTYPLQQEQIEHWFNVVKVQFPTYIEYWRNHPDVKDRVGMFQEQEFTVPYCLPSNKVVVLRGKWDSVDFIREGRAGKGGIYLQENKTKGDINPVLMQRQLTFDCQTMLYLVSLYELTNNAGWGDSERERLHKILRKHGGNIRGVRYNVIRRPLSGGKGSIVRHKPSKSNPDGESKAAFYARLRDDYIVKEPEYFFMRWKVEITEAEIDRFKREFLNPILEQLCDWWEWVTRQDHPWTFDGQCGPHWRHPYGVSNPLDEGYTTEVDEYLASGSLVGLQRTDNLFPELSSQKTHK